MFELLEPMLTVSVTIALVWMFPPPSHCDRQSPATDPDRAGNDRAGGRMRVLGANFDGSKNGVFTDRVAY